MAKIIIIAAFAFGCISDDGKIDEACDEIEDLCHWETEDSDDEDPNDTGNVDEDTGNVGKN